ncbi:hypothetical protein HMPREF3213_01020 [Heyndrickxia coagulans]|uniref:Uncharacterized protein n=1 Tax=Heyndrickxia coagulans TaxID=1398 RepID=A0A133KWN0_HEYCO|nr:hypothetical protein HMPREF3213_01020 [Heyndrickxia coagulans]
MSNHTKTMHSRHFLRGRPRRLFPALPSLYQKSNNVQPGSTEKYKKPHHSYSPLKPVPGKTDCFPHAREI